MNTKNTVGRNAAADQVRAVIERLDRDGSAPVISRNPKAADFRRVSIATGEAEAIREWVIDENATHTIEIGLAYGFSALHICEGLLLSGSPDPKHVVLDPAQSSLSGYADCGLDILKEAGVMPIVEFYGEKSQLALPRLLEEGRQFDLAFVDGNHRFDAVFVDLYYLGHLVRKGGVIILDDYDYPGIKRAASFFLKNLEWKIQETSSDGNHHWAVLRTSENEDTRNFRYFVEF